MQHIATSCADRACCQAVRNSGQRDRRSRVASGSPHSYGAGFEIRRVLGPQCGHGSTGNLTFRLVKA